ncbi:MAG: patatin-like phospholipase family protein [Gammaproteobacteria bacterium]|nr:patatin-like phospholipase family protein [Gammaproteobacteria bacterium]
MIDTAKHNVNNLAHQTLKDWLQDQPFALALSSCYFGFFAHIGVLSALEDHNLIPNKISGASAGALAGSMWASGNSMPTLTSLLFTVQRQSFWDPSLGFGLLKGERFRETIVEMAAVTTLEQCKVPISVSAYDVKNRATHTFNSGNLAACVYASCTVPLLFQPIRINGRIYLDGGIKDWAGSKGLEHYERQLQIGLYRKQRYLLDITSTRYKKIHHQTRLLALKDLIAVSPNAMHLGKDLFYQAREAMLTAIHQPVAKQMTIQA